MIHHAGATEKIVQSNYRLAEQVRRLLDDRTLAESRRAGELIGAIKQHALRCAAHPPPDEPFIVLEGAPAVHLVMERPLWEPRAAIHLDLQPILMADGERDDTSLQLLYQQFSIDTSLLQRQIETLLESQSHCTLYEVLERFPVEKGLAEIIGYLSIATGDIRHQIDPTNRDTIMLPALTNTTPRVLSVPRVIFRSPYAS